jgi:NADH-quinone oxidoreductase subunit J
MVTFPQFVFLFLSVVALFSAVMVITRRNAIHSVIWLIVTLFAVGGIFLILHAEFLFAVQIILYVGGIMVLFLFVVMLVNLDLAVKEAQFNRQWHLALLTAVILMGELGYGIYRGHNAFAPAEVAATPANMGNTQQVALALYQNYMLPVEIASILLLVAMVGAVIMAKRKLG